MTPNKKVARVDFLPYRAALIVPQGPKEFVVKLWSHNSKPARTSETTTVASCAMSLRGSDRLFAGEIHTNAYPTSNQQPKPEVGQ